MSLPLWDSVIDLFFVVRHFALFVLLLSHDCFVAVPHDATGLSAVCDCGIS